MTWLQAFGVSGGTALLFIAGCVFILKTYFGGRIKTFANIEERLNNLPK